LKKKDCLRRLSNEIQGYEKYPHFEFSGVVIGFLQDGCPNENSGGKGAARQQQD